MLDLRETARSAGIKFNARRLSLDNVHRLGEAPAPSVSTSEAVTLAAKPERIVSKIRKAVEFKRSAPISAPRKQQGPYAWDLASIRAARDAQMRGDFALPVRLAEAMRTDDALFVAYHNRIAPQAAVQTKLVAHDSTRGARVAAKAAASVQISRSVLEGIAGTLANHGIAIGYVEQETNDEGTCTDFRLTEWPLEHVKWDASREVLWTSVKDGGVREVITHGDGRWVVFRKFSVLPWTQEACVLPGAFIWASHANGVKDWALASTSHGQAKVVGTLPEGLSLQGTEQGELTPEAAGFLQLLQDLISGEGGAGIAPFGSVVNFLANGSTAWQVFSELILNREKAAARIYLGTDAMMGAAGGAPGVDISALFGVATTKIQGDFSAIEQALWTGVYQPWTAINEGDSRYAPRLVYQLPDPDAAAKAAERSAKRDQLFAAIKALRDAQMTVDQAVIDALAVEFGVSPAPQLATNDKAAIPLQLAPTDVAKVVRVVEARRSQGLAPFGDERDNMTITELDEFLKTKAAGGTTPQPTGGETPSPKLLVALAGTYDEAKHPRAEDGKFGSGGGSPSGAAPHHTAKKGRAKASRAARDALAKGKGVAAQEYASKRAVRHEAAKARHAHAIEAHAKAKAVHDEHAGALHRTKTEAKTHVENFRKQDAADRVTATNVIADLKSKEKEKKAAAKKGDVDAGYDAEELRDKRRELESSLRGADKHAALHEKYGAAVAAGDHKTAVRTADRINASNYTLRDTLNNMDHDGYYNLDVKADDLESAQVDAQTTGKKAARAERAVRAHEREVRRTAPRS